MLYLNEAVNVGQYFYNFKTYLNCKSLWLTQLQLHLTKLINVNVFETLTIHREQSEKRNLTNVVV